MESYDIRDHCREKQTENEAPVFRLSYGGQIPAQYEHARQQQRTNEDLARARLLSEKHARKSMVVRRILYLEKRRQELFAYMADSGRRQTNAYNKKLFLCIVLTSPVIALMFLLLPWFYPVGLLAGLLIAYFIIHPQKKKSKMQMHRDMEMFEMKEEHDALILEKEQLSKEIRELEELLQVDRTPRQ